MGRLPLTFVAAAALSLGGANAASAAGSTAAAAPACSYGSAVPAALSARRARAAVLCLVNRERTKRGLRALRRNAKLERAAVRYSRLMVSQSFFEHVSPGGSTLLKRIARVGYTAGGNWRAGENLAWGTGSRATPAAIVKAWMESPGHRTNMLSRSFREAGVGIASGVPEPGANGGEGATYTLELGARR